VVAQVSKAVVVAVVVSLATVVVLVDLVVADTKVVAVVQVVTLAQAATDLFVLTIPVLVQAVVDQAEWDQTEQPAAAAVALVFLAQEPAEHLELTLVVLLV
jgi:hypothetical protein